MIGGSVPSKYIALRLSPRARIFAVLGLDTVDNYYLFTILFEALRAKMVPGYRCEAFVEIDGHPYASCCLTSCYRLRALIASYASAGRNVRTLPGPNCTSFFSTEWPNVFLDTKESITGNPPCYGGGTLPQKQKERYRCYRSNIWEETSGSGQLPDTYKYVTGLTYPSRTSINGPPTGADLDPNKLHMINFYIAHSG